MTTPAAGGEWVPADPRTLKMVMRADPPIWIIATNDPKDGPAYVRISTCGRVFFVRSQRMATRFDSSAWATNVATHVSAPNRVKRLYYKGEKALEEQLMKTWVYRKPTENGAPNK